ncbi:MAG: hypothetical protein IH830_11140 [Planctomycetes bacterium]|nr:hypothetical protein [Planctomycetota bacterium]
MRIHPNQRFVAAVSIATLGVLGATLLVAEGTGKSGEPNGNPVDRAAVPLGLSPLPIPASNPQTAEKVELGKLLYFDPRLSGDATISCATCHNPALGYQLSLFYGHGPRLASRFSRSRMPTVQARPKEDPRPGSAGAPVSAG